MKSYPHYYTNVCITFNFFKLADMQVLIYPIDHLIFTFIIESHKLALWIRENVKYIWETGVRIWSLGWNNLEFLRSSLDFNRPSNLLSTDKRSLWDDVHYFPNIYRWEFHNSLFKATKPFKKKLTCCTSKLFLFRTTTGLWFRGIKVLS